MMWTKEKIPLLPITEENQTLDVFDHQIHPKLTNGKFQFEMQSVQYSPWTVAESQRLRRVSGLCITMMWRKEKNPL